MPTFEVQIESLTSLDIGSSSTPSQDDVSNFLVSGVKEVVNRITQIRPDEVVKFSTTSEDASNAGITISGKPISVVREHDSTNILRPCSLISAGDRYEATDVNSLKYRSKYSPAFYQLDGKIYTIPASAGSDNSVLVTQVYYATNTTWSSSGIENFPVEYEYLVVLYAATGCLMSKLGGISLPDDLVLPVIPVAPILSDNSVASLSTAPTYTQPSVSLDIAGIDTHIINEDPELASAVVNKVSSQLSEFQADIANELNVFNKLNVEFQADLQKKVQDAQLSSQDDAQALQKYGAEVQAYSGEIQSLVADYTAKINKYSTEYQWIQGRYAALRQQYNEAFGLLAPPKQK